MWSIVRRHQMAVPYMHGLLRTYQHAFISCHHRALSSPYENTPTTINFITKVKVQGKVLCYVTKLARHKPGQPLRWQCLEVQCQQHTMVSSSAGAKARLMSSPSMVCSLRLRKSTSRAARQSGMLKGLGAMGHWALRCFIEIAHL